MAYQNLDGIETYVAGADLSLLRGIGIVINSSGQAVAAGAGVSPDGILDNSPTSGQDARIIERRGVRQPVLSGAAFAVGAALALNSAGKFITATTGAIIVARATEAASGAGKIVSAIVFGNGGVSP